MSGLQPVPQAALAGRSPSGLVSPCMGAWWMYTLVLPVADDASPPVGVPTPPPSAAARCAPLAASMPAPVCARSIRFSRSSASRRRIMASSLVSCFLVNSSRYVSRARFRARERCADSLFFVARIRRLRAWSCSLVNPSVDCCSSLRLVSRSGLSSSLPLEDEDEQAAKSRFFEDRRPISAASAAPTTIPAGSRSMQFMA